MIVDLDRLISSTELDLDLLNMVLTELSAFYRVNFELDRELGLLSIEPENVEPYPLVKDSHSHPDYSFIKEGEWGVLYMEGRRACSLGGIERAREIYTQIKWEMVKRAEKDLLDVLNNMPLKL